MQDGLNASSTEKALSGGGSGALWGEHDCSAADAGLKGDAEKLPDAEPSSLNAAAQDSSLKIVLSIDEEGILPLSLTISPLPRSDTPPGPQEVPTQNTSGSAAAARKPEGSKKSAEGEASQDPEAGEGSVTADSMLPEAGSSISDVTDMSYTSASLFKPGSASVTSEPESNDAPGKAEGGFPSPILDSIDRNPSMKQVPPSPALSTLEEEGGEPSLRLALPQLDIPELPTSLGAVAFLRATADAGEVAFQIPAVGKETPEGTDGPAHALDEPPVKGEDTQESSFFPTHPPEDSPVKVGNSQVGSPLVNEDPSEETPTEPLEDIPEEGEGKPQEDYPKSTQPQADKIPTLARTESLVGAENGEELQGKHLFFGQPLDDTPRNSNQPVEDWDTPQVVSPHQPPEDSPEEAEEPPSTSKSAPLEASFGETEVVQATDSEQFPLHPKGAVDGATAAVAVDTSKILTAKGTDESNIGDEQKKPADSEDHLEDAADESRTQGMPSIGQALPTTNSAFPGAMSPVSPRSISQACSIN
jgi:hypothetical protein